MAMFGREIVMGSATLQPHDCGDNTLLSWRIKSYEYMNSAIIMTFNNRRREKWDYDTRISIHNYKVGLRLCPWLDQDNE